MSCNTIKNTGVPKCSFLLKDIRRPMFVPKFDSSGTLNELTNVAAATKSAFQAKFDAVDVDDRWFVLPEMEQGLNERAETEFFTYDSGNKTPLRKGARHFSGVFPLEYAYLIEKIESFQGSEVGIYGGDADSNLVYYKDAETLQKVRPLEIDGNSLSATYLWHKNDTPAGVMIEFDFKHSMKDALIDYVASENLDFDPLSTDDWYAQIDVTTKLSTVTSATNITFTATLIDDFGKPVKGLVLGDFTCEETAGYTDMPITSITEGADGVYAGVFTGIETEEDAQLFIVKTSYNFNESNEAASTGGFSFTVATIAST